MTTKKIKRIKRVKPKTQRGRPTKKTVATVRKLEAAFGLGCSATEAAYHADISRQSLYQWMNEDSDFSDKMKRQQARPVLQARRVIWQNLKKGNLKTAQWFLERKAPDEFGTRDVMLNRPFGDTNREPRSIAELFSADSNHNNETDKYAD